MVLDSLQNSSLDAQRLHLVSLQNTEYIKIAEIFLLRNTRILIHLQNNMLHVLNISHHVMVFGNISGSPKLCDSTVLTSKFNKCSCTYQKWFK